MSARGREELAARFDTLIDLLADEVLLRVEEKLHERKVKKQPATQCATPVMTVPQIGRRVLRLRDVCLKTGLSRSTIYKGVKEGWFPLWIKLSERSSAWHEHEIDAFLTARTAARGKR